MKSYIFICIRLCTTINLIVLSFAHAQINNVPESLKKKILNSSGLTEKQLEKIAKDRGANNFDIQNDIIGKQIDDKNPKKEQEIIEMIDIGGPSLLRAASKNYKYVTPILNTNDYYGLIKNLKKNNGETDIIFRKNMASKIFKETSKYDEIIYRWFLEK